MGPAGRDESDTARICWFMGMKYPTRWAEILERCKHQLANHMVLSPLRSTFHGFAERGTLNAASEDVGWVGPSGRIGRRE
jgi:hypothetical protein